MTRTLKVLLLLCVAAAFAAAAGPKKNPDVEKAVKAELVKKTFDTKILVGSYIPCPPNVNSSGRSDAIKAVDTELSPGGAIQYYARAGCFFPGGFSIDGSRFYVTGPLSAGLQIGTTVWIRSVDFKEDRVELNLSANNSEGADGSGKIKYMLGANYRTLSKDDLMEALAQGIRVPAYEKLVQVKTEFAALRGNLETWEKAYNAPGLTSDAKLTAAISLQVVLEKLERNRAAFTAMGKTDPEAGIYADKLKALTPEIARLTEEARMARVAGIRGELQAQLPKVTEVQAQVRAKPVEPAAKK